MKTITIADAKVSAEKRLADIDGELAKLDQDRASLSLDHTLGDASAEQKLRATGDKVRALQEERDRLLLVEREIERRETDDRQQAEQKRERGLRAKQARHRDQRQEAYGQVVAAMIPLEAAIKAAIDAGAELWSVTMQLHEPPDIKTRDRLTVYVSRRLNEAGLTDFDRHGDLYTLVERELNP